MKKLIALLLVGALFLVGCENANRSKNQEANQRTTEAFAEKLTAAVPYPIDQMGDSLERRNVKERLLRFNDADKIGYVYLLTLTGNFVGFYTIKGKISSVQSQMTISQQIVRTCDGCGSFVVDSMGDDGSYGSNEGGDNGIFFFTTEGTMVETTMPWLYSDAPLPVDAKKLNDD